MRKLSKATYGFIFAIVALVILLGISLYLGLSGWFFANTTRLESDLVLGQTVNMTLSGSEARVVSFTFPGNLLPGQKLEQFINITNAADDDLHVRAKAVIFDHSDGEIGVEVGISSHWTEHDGYYYFDEPLLKANKISLGSFIKLLPDKYYNSKKSYILTIVVEALDKDLDRSVIWGF